MLRLSASNALPRLAARVAPLLDVPPLKQRDGLVPARRQP